MICSKFCPKCDCEKSTGDFNRNVSCPDGFQGYCRLCQGQSNSVYNKSARGRLKRSEHEKTPKSKARILRYRQSDKGKATAREYLFGDDDRYKGRYAVTNAVKLGNMPRAADCVCSSCGEPAREYHHHLGYGREHWLDVTPVCKPCHVKAGQ